MVEAQIYAVSTNNRLRTTVAKTIADLKAADDLEKNMALIVAIYEHPSKCNMWHPQIENPLMTCGQIVYVWSFMCLFSSHIGYAKRKCVFENAKSTDSDLSHAYIKSHPGICSL